MRKSLLLLPGLLCDEGLWGAQVASLSDVADIRVTDDANHDNLAVMAESILARAPPRFAIAGHSMGGRVALEVARRAPERLIGVGLLNTGCEPLASGEAGAREKARRYAFLELARREGMRAMARSWVQGMIHPGRLDDRELVDSILAMFERRTPDVLERQVRALLGRPDATLILGTLQCPALVLCGQDDGAGSPAVHTAMAARIPNSTLRVLPACGHMSPLERPREVSEALREWLNVVS